jgi:hypothetical protein
LVSSRGVGRAEVPIPTPTTTWAVEGGGPWIREGVLVLVFVGDRELCEDGRWYYQQDLGKGH